MDSWQSVLENRGVARLRFLSRGTTESGARRRLLKEPSSLSYLITRQAVNYVFIVSS